MSAPPKQRARNARACPIISSTLAEWNEDFDAARYAAAALQCKGEVVARGCLPLVVGGTGLYLRALLGHGWHADLPQDAALRAELAALTNDQLVVRLRQLDPERAAELHPNDRVRLLRSVELVTLLGQPLRAAGLTAAKPADAAAILVPARSAASGPPCAYPGTHLGHACGWPDRRGRESFGLWCRSGLQADAQHRLQTGL